MNDELRNKLQEYASDLLLKTVREYSEDCWCAGWLGNMEYELWAMIGKWTDGGPSTVEWGQGTVDVERLNELSLDARGWWTYEDGVGKRFVPMVDWLLMNNDYLTKRNALKELAIESEELGI